MKDASVIVVVILLLLLPGTICATGADQFVYQSSHSFDKAIDIATSTDRIFVLSPGTLTVLNAATQTPTLERIVSITVSKDLVHVAAFGDIVVLASRRNLVEIYQLIENEFVHRSDFSSLDSIANLALVEDLLFVAQGYGGVNVIDLSDVANPALRQTLTEPDYALDVDMAGDYLFVLDVLNGVTVFSKSGGQFRYFDEILCETQPTDIGAFKNGVAIAFGSQRSEVWYCSESNGALLERVIETDYEVSRIAVNRESDEILYMASETGNISSVGIVAARSTYPHPIAKLIAIENSSLYSLVALDRFGSLTAFRSGQNLESRASYQGEATPSAMTATSGALLLSTPAGIQELTRNNTNLGPRMIIPGAAITPILAESDPWLFAGAPQDGTIRIYQKERGRWFSHSELTSGLALKQIFAFGANSDEVTLIAVGEDGIASYSLEPDDTFSPRSSIVSDGVISGADISGNLMATIYQNGKVAIYSFEVDQITFVGATQCVTRPRDVEITGDGFIAISHATGIQIFEFDQATYEFIEHQAPSAISTAFDLFYDQTSHELLFATGPTPVRYLDFSNPTDLGTVYLIPGTEGTDQIAYRENELYCLSADWIRLYERVDQSQTGRQNSTLREVSVTPNPFNANTQMTIELNPNVNLPSRLDISFVNILGQTLYRKELTANSVTLTFPLPQLIGEEPAIASGVYFFVVRAAGEVITRKLVLLK